MFLLRVVVRNFRNLCPILDPEISTVPDCLLIKENTIFTSEIPSKSADKIESKNLNQGQNVFTNSGNPIKSGDKNLHGFRDTILTEKIPALIPWFMQRKHWWHCVHIRYYRSNQGSTSMYCT